MSPILLKNQLLIQGAEKGDIDLVRSALSSGAEVDCCDYDGNSSLHLAARGGHRLIAKLLLEAGGSVNKHNTAGRCPIHTAAECGSIDVIEELIRSGVPIDQPDWDQNTPLHCAASSGSEKVVHFLIRMGADTRAANRANKSPKDEAIDHYHGELARAISIAQPSAWLKELRDRKPGNNSR